MRAELAKRVIELGGAVTGIIVWRRVSARIHAADMIKCFQMVDSLIHKRPKSLV